MTKRKEKNNLGGAGTARRERQYCVYIHQQQLMYIFCLCRAAYTCWEYQRMMGCRVSSFTAGSLYNMYIFSNLFWKKGGKNM